MCFTYPKRKPSDIHRFERNLAILIAITEGVFMAVMWWVMR